MHWYKDHASEDFSVESVKRQEWEPDSSPNASYFQKLMADSDSIRDKFSAATIYSALQSHDRVIVVYGSAHEPKQAQVFQQVFNQKPVYRNLEGWRKR